jgi:dihydroorotase-like cyclic amidohydrolase
MWDSGREEPMADIVVEGGTLVIPGVGTLRAGVAVEGGRIIAVAQDGDLPAARERVDACGKFVFPGFFDPHIHLGQVLSFDEECETETRAALAGGITTVGCFMRRLEGSYREDLPAWTSAVEKRASADLVFHLQIFTRQQREEIPRYAAEDGITSFKVYMAGIPKVVPAVDDGFILETMRAVASLGDRAILAVHCENQAMLDVAYEQAVGARGEQGTLADWADTRPNYAEEEAVVRAAYMAGLAGVRLYIVHLSTAEAAARLREIRARNPRITVETTSMYLTVNKFDPAGLLAKMVPPVRRPEDQEALWQAVRDGLIDTFGTDNTSRNLAAKKPEAGWLKAMSGYPALATHVPLLLHEGYHRRGIPLQVIAEKGCRNPAIAYGIYPQKGTIAAGSDADLAIVDLDCERVVDPKTLHSFSDFNVHQGRVLKGWPVVTIKGGVVAVRDNEVLLPPGRCRVLRRTL